MEQATMDFMDTHYEQWRIEIRNADPMSEVLGELRGRLMMMQAHIEACEHMVNYHATQATAFQPFTEQHTWHIAKSECYELERDWLMAFHNKLAETEKNLRTALTR